MTTSKCYKKEEGLKNEAVVDDWLLTTEHCAHATSVVGSAMLSLPVDTAIAHA